MPRFALPLALMLALWPALARADTWAPGPFAIGDQTVVGFIDSPRSGDAIKQGDQLSLYGWVVDSASTGWTGIDEVHVYRGTAADTFLGRATYAIERSDVSAHFGNPNWKNSGFSLTIDTAQLPLGASTLTVYAHTPARGWWSAAVSVSITREAPPQESGELITWRTPHAQDLRTMASLVPALSALGGTPWGRWALDAAADRGVQVVWASELGNRYSSYQYGARVISINAAYRTAQPQAVATAIAHELAHALDDVHGWAAWRALSCQDLETRALVTQAATWQAFFGPFGKVQATDALEQVHNTVLSVVTAKKSTWLDEAMAAYRSPCPSSGATG